MSQSRIKLCLDRNIEAIRSTGGFIDIESLAGALPSSVATPELKARVTRSQKGLPNIEMEFPGGAKVNAHDDNDPFLEARNAFSDGQWTGRHAILYGLGCGYLIEAAAEAVGENGSVTVVECSPSLANAALIAIDFSWVENLKNVKLLIGRGDKVVPILLSIVRDIEASSSEIESRLFFHNPSLAALPPFDHPIRIALNLLRQAYYMSNVSENPPVRALFDEVHKSRITGARLTDMELATLFAEGLYTDHRFYFTDTPFEPAEPSPDTKNILFICLANMGDVISGSTVLNGLRMKHPSARIVFLTERPSASLFKCGEYIDRIIEYPQNEKLNVFLSDPTLENFEALRRQFLELIEELRAENFDAIYNLQSSARSAVIAGALGVPASASVGYSLDPFGMPTVRGNLWMHLRLLEKIPIARAPEEHNIRTFGLAPLERKLCVHIPDDSEKPLRHPSRDRALKGRAIGVNPFASTPGREWGEEKFEGLCRVLSEEMDFDVIVFAGTAKREIEIAEKICGNIGARASLCAALPPDDAARIARECRLFITNDTGPMHFAGAAGARCLAVQGPMQLLPYQSIGHIGISSPLSCTGCGPFPGCKHKQCFEMIEPAQVARIAGVMIENGPKETLTKLAGFLNDGIFPHMLITSGTYDSLTPRFLIRLRSALPIEANIVAEWTRIAVLNTLILMEAGALDSRRHPLGVNHPGLAAPFTTETSLREVLKRHDFYDYDLVLVRKIFDEVLDLCGAEPKAIQPEKIPILFPIMSFHNFLNLAELTGLRAKADSYCMDFLCEIRRFMTA